ncbi:MAG: FAD-linked oxidase C-terminal domain-containing protein, partial [Halobacteriales archaeon]
RNVSGYNLDWLVEDLRGEPRRTGEPDGTGDSVNLAKLLAGSEGTLAVVTEAEVSLAPVPETKGMALLTYDELGKAMADVATILEFDPAAVELVDDELIDLARNRPEFEETVAMLPEGTEATLLVEFYADDGAGGERKVAELLADRQPEVATAGDPGEDPRDTGEPVRAFDAVEAHDAQAQADVWKLRKAGLPILLSRTTDDKHIAFIEDTAIPPENLPEYVADFQEILDDHDTFASFYAHAGPGVLHIRPLVNTKTEAGVETMASIADEVTDLVVEYGGSVSGEHGDGRARTAWNRKLYGESIWSAFRDLKSAFDPDWLLNPGQVVERPDEPTDMTADLRFDPDYGTDLGFDPVMEWDNDNGIEGMVELCHGCGGCRGPQDTTGGVMCPTYRASREEITSTRGRANMLRQAISGDLPDDVTDEEFVTEVMDLCVGCKGCKNDCPSGVDMAKLKAEVEHAYHQEHGASLRDRLFTEFDRLSKLASTFAPVSNWAISAPGAGLLAERVAGIHRDRDLPEFSRETVHGWFADRGSRVPADSVDRTVVLLVDSDTNYANPSLGRAVVRVLEAAGVHVELADTTDSGRPAHSRGMLDHSKATAAENVDSLAPRIEDGYEVVCVEPSDAVMLQSDYVDLLGDAADPVPDNAYGVAEYLDRFDLVERVDWGETDKHLTYHGHCHQKATNRDGHAVSVLRAAGYDVDELDSGCCGMAGTFGYEAEHYEMSQAIGEILFEQIDASPGEETVAPGTSCRAQIGTREEREAEPPHPAEKLAALL